MNTPPVYRAQTISDLLNVVPTLFGFVPHESLIGICVVGERRKFGFRLRVDLPSPQGTEQLAEVVADHLERGDGDQVILLAISADQLRSHETIGAVARRLTTKSIRCAVWADDAHWWSLDDPERAHAWTPDPFHESIVTAVGHGQVIHANRDAVAQEFEPESHAISETFIERVEHEIKVAMTKPTNEFTDERIEHVADLIARMKHGEELSDRELAHIGILLTDILVRDHFWFAIDRPKAREYLALWSTVARHLPGAWRSAPLALASFAAWQVGDGVRALLAAEAAVKEDRDYSLANIMLRVLEQGMPPESWDQMRRGLRSSA